MSEGGCKKIRLVVNYTESFWKPRVQLGNFTNVGRELGSEGPNLVGRGEKEREVSTPELLEPEMSALTPQTLCFLPPAPPQLGLPNLPFLPAFSPVPLETSVPGSLGPHTPQRTHGTCPPLGPEGGSFPGACKWKRFTGEAETRREGGIFPLSRVDLSCLPGVWSP